MRREMTLCCSKQTLRQSVICCRAFIVSYVEYVTHWPFVKGNSCLRKKKSTNETFFVGHRLKLQMR